MGYGNTYQARRVIESVPDPDTINAAVARLYGKLPQEERQTHLLGE